MRCWVSGKVQGVWYRGKAQRMAEELGLVGYAKNLRDGRVEVLACGAEASLEQLHQWLWEGPRSAQVSDVHCELTVEVDPLPAYFNVV